MAGIDLAAAVYESYNMDRVIRARADTRHEAQPRVSLDIAYGRKPAEKLYQRKVPAFIFSAGSYLRQMGKPEMSQRQQCRSMTLCWQSNLWHQYLRH